MLYWVAAVEEPTKKQRQEEAMQETVIMQPKIVSAKDDKMAAVKVIREAIELKDKNLDRISVVVRPF
jgi:hypothetical protein